MSFLVSLKQGQMGEGVIAKWLRSKGWYVAPAYEVEEGSGKGPRLFGSDRELITPDMIVFKPSDKQPIRWLEAKDKEAFTEHHNTKTWNTGIDKNKYSDYLRVEDATGIPVYLAFLHRGGQAKDSPPSPSGLYIDRLCNLKNRIHHEHENWGRHGMVYWTPDVFSEYHSLDELRAAGAFTN